MLRTKANKNAPLKTGRFCLLNLVAYPVGKSADLDFADVKGVRALWAFADLKGDLVAFLELIERNVLELVGMEEKILRTFRRAFDFDEAEALLVLLDYCAVLHS